MSSLDPRLWAKISVDYFDNPKIEALSDAAQLLHLSLILKAKAQQTGGVLTVRACKARGDRAFRELVKAGLLEDVGERSYRIHDYEKHQNDHGAEEISVKRAAAGGRGAHTTNHVKRLVYDESCPHCQRDSVDGADWLRHPDLTVKAA